MAYITVGSKFTPFSYEEKVRPFMEYNQAYSNVETAYNDLLNKAGTVAASLSETTDPEAYTKYKTLYDKLNEAAEQLSTKGLNTSMRAGLLQLHKDYRKAILPIAKAVDVRDKEYQRRKSNKDSSVIYEKENISIDDIMKDPDNYDFGRELSMNDIYTQISKFATPYSDTYRGSSSWYETAEGQALERKDRYGYTEQEINDIISGNDKTSPLAQRYNEFLDSLDIWDWEGMLNSNNEYTDKGNKVYNQLANIASYGLSSAIGTTKLERIANKNFNTDSDPSKPTPVDKIESTATTHTVFGANQKGINKMFKKDKQGVSVLDVDGSNNVSFNPAYIPTKRQDSTPLDVYDYYQEHLEEAMSKAPKHVYDPSGTVAEMRAKIHLNYYNKVKELFGVDKILSKSEYDALKTTEGGLSSGESFEYTSYSLPEITDSFSDETNYFKNVKNTLTKNAVGGNNQFHKDTVYELVDGPYSSNMKEVREIHSMLGEDSTIEDVVFDMARPNYLRITVKTKGVDKKGKKGTFVHHYLVKPSVFGAEVKGSINTFNKYKDIKEVENIASALASRMGVATNQ